jgi:hypothetical protein
VRAAHPPIFLNPFVNIGSSPDQICALGVSSMKVAMSLETTGLVCRGYIHIDESKLDIYLEEAGKRES